MVTILSPVAGGSQASEYPSFRALISEDGEIFVSWLLDDGSGAPPYQIGFGGESGNYLDAMYLLPGEYIVPAPPTLPLHAGSYTVRMTATDPAGNTGSSAPLTMTFVDPDTGPRIVVRSFSVLEFEDPSGSGKWRFAPQLVVADAPGAAGLEIVGFEMLSIPGLTTPYMWRLYSRGLAVPSGQDIQLFHEQYGDYGVTFGSGDRRSSGGEATARLTYRDGTGHFYAAMLEGPIVPGPTRPQTYTGGCNHWYVQGMYRGDMSYCGWSGRVGDRNGMGVTSP